MAHFFQVFGPYPSPPFFWLIQFTAKQFEAPFPLWIKATWSLALAALFLVTIGLLVKDFTNKKKKDQIEEPAVEVKASVSKGRK